VPFERLRALSLSKRLVLVIDPAEAMFSKRKKRCHPERSRSGSLDFARDDGAGSRALF
jgi:hypothetical protein